MSSELVASVQSLVAVLQQQIDTSSPQDAAHKVRCSQETRLMHPQQIGVRKKPHFIDDVEIKKLSLYLNAKLTI